jgi:hypothetical protein
MSPEYESRLKRIRGSRAGRIIVLIVQLVGIALFAAACFLVWAFKTGRAVDWARTQVVTALRDKCDVQAKFENIRFDPFPPTLELKEVELTQLDGAPILSVEDAIATLQILPLFMQRLELDRVSVDKPKASIALEKGRILDLPKCVEPPAEKPTSPPIVLGVRELTMNAASIDLKVDDELRVGLDDFDVQVSPGSGGSNVWISFTTATVATNAQKLALRDFRFQGHLEGLLTEPRAAVIDRLDAQVGRARISVTKGSIDLIGPVYDADVSLDAPIDMVHDFIKDFPEARGMVHLAATVQGNAIIPRAQGRLVVEDGKIDQFELADKTTLDFSVDRDGLDIHKLDARIADGQVEGKGRISFDKHLTVKLETKGHNLSLGRVLDDIGIKNAWVDFVGDGTGKFAGTLLEPTELKGPFSYDVKDFYVYDGSWDRPQVKWQKDQTPRQHVMLHPPGPIHVRGNWLFNDKGANFVADELSSGVTSGKCEAHLRFATMEGARIIAQLSSFDFADLGPIAQIKFRGHGRLDGQVFGPYTDIGAQGGFELDDISIAQIPFGHGKANVHWHGIRNLDFEGIEGKLGETSFGGSVGIKLTGEVPFHIKADISEGRIEEVLVPFGVHRSEWGDPRGAVTASAELDGPITRMTGPIQVSLGAGSILGETFEGGVINGRLDRGAVAVDDVTLKKHGAILFGGGRLDPYGGEVQAHVKSRDLTLQKIDLMHASEPNLEGTLAVDLALSGNMQLVTGTIAANLTSATAGSLGIQDGRIVGKIRNSVVMLKGRVLEESLKLEGEVDLVRGLPYKAQLDLKEYDVPKLLSALAGHSRYRGLVAGHARLFGSLIDWPHSSGEIALDKAIFESESIKLETQGPSTFAMRQGVLETRRIVLVNPTTRLIAEGRLGSQLLDLKVVGKVDLAIAEVLSPQIERVGGMLSLDCAVTGEPGAMNMVGSGRITSGILQWRGFPDILTGVSADLSFSQATVLIDHGQGRWSNGKVGISGNLVLNNYRVKEMALQIALEDAMPRFSYPTTDLTGRLRGNLVMEGPLNRLKVHGDLDVYSPSVKPKIQLERFTQRRGLASNVYDPSAEVIDMDIGFHSKDPVRVKSDNIEVDMKGDIRLTGTNQRVGMLGSATVVPGGRVYAFLRAYELLAGSLEFQDRYRWSPRFDLWVAADACSARIRANLVGTLDKFGASYSSNPAMDEANILSCLIRGVRIQELDNDLSKFASGALLKYSGVDREVRKVLPVDDINLTTEYSPATRQYEPRIYVSKDLQFFGSQARLEASSSLIRSEDRSVALRYRITPQLTLQGGWVTKPFTVQPLLGDVGLDLKYRWEW